MYVDVNQSKAIGIFIWIAYQEGIYFINNNNMYNFQLKKRLMKGNKNKVRGNSF